MTRKRREVQLLADDLPIFTGTWYGPGADRATQPAAKPLPPLSEWGWCGSLLDGLDDETTTDTGKDGTQ
jgi:hypothetical protein